MIFFQVSFYRGKRTFEMWYYFIQNNISVVSSIHGAELCCQVSSR